MDRVYGLGSLSYSQDMITFVTSNTGKFLDFQYEMTQLGLTAVQQSLSIDEPQETSIREIALHKARQAYATLQKPLVVEDSGLCIPALNNFPEALTKPIFSQVGIDGFTQLLSALNDRRCFFTCALAYADIDGNIDVMVSNDQTGTLTRQPQGEITTARARSDLWRLYQPTGWDKTMAEMIDDELTNLFDSWRPQHTFARFAQLAAADPGRFGLPKAA